jgi:hypothetical protein
VHSSVNTQFSSWLLCYDGGSTGIMQQVCGWLRALHQQCECILGLALVAAPCRDLQVFCSQCSSQVEQSMVCMWHAPCACNFTRPSLVWRHMDWTYPAASGLGTSCGGHDGDTCGWFAPSPRRPKAWTVGPSLRQTAGITSACTLAVCLQCGPISSTVAGLRMATAAAQRQGADRGADLDS